MWKEVLRIPEQLGPLLRAERLRQGLTQLDVARRLGVTVQEVSRLENNADRASFDRVHRVCRVLKLELSLGTVSAKSVSDKGAW